ncbi:MAG TPA: hypothetical protein VGF84_20970, partial [Micromonosporaceae bacterium]
MEHEGDSRLPSNSMDQPITAGEIHLEIETSEPSSLSPLNRWVSSIPDTQVQRIAREPLPHEQGAVDILA